MCRKYITFINLFQVIYKYTLLAGMEGVISRFQELRVSKGHLLTVKGDVQRVKDAFFVGKLFCIAVANKNNTKYNKCSEPL